MSHGFRARTEVAVVGFAHSQVQRHAPHPLGVIALDTVQRAIADAGLTPEQVDGFTTGSLLPILSGGGAIGNGRMHGLAQMVECYLQLSQRAGERQLATTDIGLACHSSPHYGGAVLYSAERL